MTTSTHLHRAFPGPSVDEAFRDFVQINTPALTRTAYVLTGSASAAEEMVQDTLVRLYRNGRACRMPTRRWPMRGAR